MKSAMTSAACCVSLLLAIGPVQAQENHVTAVTGATLIDGTARPHIEDAVILIDGARISQVGPGDAVVVPPGATVIDARGRYVIPGLADMHNHLQSGSMRAQQNLRLGLSRLLAVGVTTVFNPSIGLEDFATLKAAAADEAAPVARFFGTGPIVTVEGDVLGQLVGAPTPRTASEARSVVRELRAAGVDAIKVQRDDASWSIRGRFPLMRPEVLSALVDEAHGAGLKVFAHAPMLAQAKEALRAGVDGLMHGIIDAPVDQEFIDLMTRNRASYVSTMALYHDVANVAAWARRQAPNWDRAALQPPRLYESFTTPAGIERFESIFTNSDGARRGLPVQRSNLKRVFDADIPVVLGTDSGFFGILIGVSTQIELELLVEAGLSPADALRTATVNAARMIGREADFGTIEPGKLADLVILEADPATDIRDVTRVVRTLKGGVAYEPVDPARPLQ